MPDFMEKDPSASSRLIRSGEINKRAVFFPPLRCMDSVFGRLEELVEIRAHFFNRRSFLMYGESGVGKTLLVKTVAREFSDVLYCSDSSTGQSVFRELAVHLLAAKDPLLRRACGRRGTECIESKSTLALRGLVLDAIHHGHYWIVLDHLRRTSASLASDVRDMMLWGNTPVVAIARSGHMEDLGFLTSYFSLKEDRLQIRPFEPEQAEQFANHIADQVELFAGNRAEFLEKVIAAAEGLPGPIIKMISMARLPKYRLQDYVKFSPIYIDFRLQWHAANAS
jgi:hypothetical protein